MADPIDVHVGTRLRARRKELGLSQQQLGTHLGMTFQQVQKYERGTNRISASVMWKACEVLSVDPNYMFAGLLRDTAKKVEKQISALSGLFDTMIAQGGQRLMQNFVALSRARRTIVTKLSDSLMQEEVKERPK